jgi:hypothetical protein
MPEIFLPFLIQRLKTTNELKSRFGLSLYKQGEEYNLTCLAQAQLKPGTGHAAG